MIVITNVMYNYDMTLCAWFINIILCVNMVVIHFVLK